MTTCRACRERGKTWEGQDPKCSFEDGKEFSPEGWNCATTNEIRLLLQEDSLDAYQDIKINLQYCDDQKYATLNVSEVGLPSGPKLCLFVIWYKHRGRTDAMQLISWDGETAKPTENDCIAILDYFKKRAQAKGG